MINEKWPFYVKVEACKLGAFKYEMKFFYNTDERFSQYVTSVDASAIEAWINGKKYDNKHNDINF